MDGNMLTLMSAAKLICAHFLALTTLATHSRLNCFVLFQVEIPLR